MQLNVIEVISFELWHRFVFAIQFTKVYAAWCMVAVAHSEVERIGQRCIERALPELRWSDYSNHKIKYWTWQNKTFAFVENVSPIYGNAAALQTYTCLSRKEKEFDQLFRLCVECWMRSVFPDWIWFVCHVFLANNDSRWKEFNF